MNGRNFKDAAIAFFTGLAVLLVIGATTPGIGPETDWIKNFKKTADSQRTAQTNLFGGMGATPGQVYQATNADGSGNFTAMVGGSGSGETNTASNLGQSNATVKPFFFSKSGVDLRFFSVEQGSGITLTMTPTSIVFTATGGASDWALYSTNALTAKLASNLWWEAWGSLSTNALTAKLDSNSWWTAWSAAWGSLSTNALTAKLDSNSWWTVWSGAWGAISTNALTAKLDSNTWWTANQSIAQAPGTSTIVVDGSVYSRTSVLTGAITLIYSNLPSGQTIEWWGFSSNGAWTITVPQAHTSNTIDAAIQQPASNTWVRITAKKISSGWTNFDSKARGLYLGVAGKMVQLTNAATGTVINSNTVATVTNLDDVAIVAPSAGQVLAFNSSLGKYYPSNQTASGSATVDPITNRYDTANTFTNRGALRQEGSANFGTNTVTDGTNVMNWVRLPNLTASRALVLDSNKGVANPTGTPDGTKFLRDDNTYAATLWSDLPTNSMVNTSGPQTITGAKGIGTVTVNTNLEAARILTTNGVGFVNKTLSGVGGANTNFTGLWTDGVVYIDGGTTNVNFVAIMPGVAGVTYFPTYIITNLTTTSRQLSFASTTNFLINLQRYDGVTLPVTITNKHRVILTGILNNTNFTYAIKICTNGF